VLEQMRDNASWEQQDAHLGSTRERVFDGLSKIYLEASTPSENGDSRSDMTDDDLGE
jgi:hypothetical protein